MATGRTKPKWIRVYANGRDLSGFGRTIGPLIQECDEDDMTATMADTIKGYYKGHASVSAGVYNGVFDNTATTGAHAVLGTADTLRNLIVAYGIRAAPAAGDPAFCGGFRQLSYQATTEGGATTFSADFTPWDLTASTTAYGMGWGQLLHAYGAETAANTGTGFDCPQAAATTWGGYFIYSIYSVNAGTATLSVDDSADNTNFLALASATSGAIAAASCPTSGIVALSQTATVRRYLRFQVALAGGATTCTFVSAFVRGQGV